MKVVDIVARVAEVLQDVSGVIWTSSQVKQWLHEAELSVCFVRPDAYSVMAPLPLVADTRQSLDNLIGQPVPIRLLDVVRNTTALNAPGKAVRRIARGDLDAADPDWHIATAVVAPTEFCFDDRSPRELYVNPPADGTGLIEVLYAAVPPAYDLGDANQLIAVRDSYVPALIEWALYRCFSRDSEMTRNWQRGQTHLQSFFNVLGIKTNSDRAVSLKQGAHLN